MFTFMTKAFERVRGKRVPTARRGHLRKRFAQSARTAKEQSAVVKGTFSRTRHESE